jgi:hypothetical protein
MSPLAFCANTADWVTSGGSLQFSFFRREKHVPHNARRDPQQTRENHMARDLLLADYMKQEALTRNLKLLEIDGSHAFTEMAAIVAAHFAPVIDRLHSR